MDGLEFIASMTGSLAWPALIGTLLIAYRKPIIERIGSLRSAKYKDVELFFGKELRELDAEVKSLPPPVPKEERKAVSALHHASPIDPLNDAERLLNADLPDPAIFSAWSTVEHELRRFLVAHNMRNVVSHQISTSEQINALAQAGLADGPTIDVLRRMNNLFNLLAYGGGANAEVTADQAREYIALARSVIERFRQLE